MPYQKEMMEMLIIETLRAQSEQEASEKMALIKLS
jgi:hypothetical protein